MTLESQTEEEINNALIALFERETGRRPGEYTAKDFMSWADRNKDRLEDLVFNWSVSILVAGILEGPDNDELIRSWRVGADGKPERVYRFKDKPPQNPG
jgi:hypothetical protein